MSQITDKEPAAWKGSASDHLANERTFLAWIRTSIGLMAFGFAVAKFTLFVRQLTYSVQKQVLPSHGYSNLLGMLLVGIGTLIGLLSYLRYRRLEKQLQTGHYPASQPLSGFLTIFILLIGVLLILYLLNSL